MKHVRAALQRSALLSAIALSTKLSRAAHESYSESAVPMHWLPASMVVGNSNSIVSALEKGR